MASSPIHICLLQPHNRHVYKHTVSSCLHPHNKTPESAHMIGPVNQPVYLLVQLHIIFHVPNRTNSDTDTAK